MRTRLLRPVKNRQYGLTLVFAQKKNARLLILICVCQEIQRQSSSPKFRHGKQIRIPDQSHAFWITPEGWEVVANFEHSSGNRRQRDRHLRLIQCERDLNGSLFQELPGNREGVRVSDEKVAMHVIARRDARLQLPCCGETHDLYPGIYGLRPPGQQGSTSDSHLYRGARLRRLLCG